MPKDTNYRNIKTCAAIYTREAAGSSNSLGSRPRCLLSGTCQSDRSDYLFHSDIHNTLGIYLNIHLGKQGCSPLGRLRPGTPLGITLRQKRPEVFSGGPSPNLRQLVWRRKGTSSRGPHLTPGRATACVPAAVAAVASRRGRRRPRPRTALGLGDLFGGHAIFDDIPCHLGLGESLGGAQVEPTKSRGHRPQRVLRPPTRNMTAVGTFDAPSTGGLTSLKKIQESLSLSGLLQLFCL